MEFSTFFVYMKLDRVKKPTLNLKVIAFNQQMALFSIAISLVKRMPSAG